jgi:mannose-6-phosphate isomerase-like protein (cupin superfamily)
MSEHITPEQAEQARARAGERYITMLKEGRLELEYYKPLGQDPQKPHSRDEMYFVIAGTGWFVIDGQRKPFAANDVLFAAAGVPHRFEGFSEDFATWAVFVGQGVPD